MATSAKLSVPRALRVALDFDGTLTQRDTLDELSKVAYSTSNTAKKPWAFFANAYVEDMKSHAAQYMPRKEDRRSVQDEKAWLASLRPAEAGSMQRARREGLFEDVSCEHIDAAARQAVQRGSVAFRPGWISVVEKVKSFGRDGEQRGSALDVISVNWSREWISRCIAHGAQRHEATFVGAGFGDASGDPASRSGDGLGIYGNEVCGFVDGPLQGIHTSRDKLECFVRSNVIADATSENASVLSIYVGDSPTDFECILRADLGICIRDLQMSTGQRELAWTLERVGVEVCKLESFDETSAKDMIVSLEKSTATDEQPPTTARTRVWCANSFHDLDNWLQRWATVLCARQL